MGKGKRERKKKIRKKIMKQVPKIKRKKKKAVIISKEKKQTKWNGLFQPFFKAFENFKKKQKIESFKQIKFGGKERERQIKEEQKKLKEEAKIMRGKKEYYTEELEKVSKDKMKALQYQKYYTAGAIILMFVVLASMYFLLR